MPEHNISYYDLIGEAVKQTEIYAQKLMTEHPEIKTDAKDMSYTQISKKYSVADKFGVTEALAESIVRVALTKLISPEELDRINTIRSAQQQGGALPNNIKNILKKDAASRAGKIGGQVTLKNKLGLFSLSQEELNKRRLAAGVPHGWEGQRINGKTEAEYAIELASQPEYQRPAGDRFEGTPDYKKIAEAVNKIYNQSRGKEDTRMFFKRGRKKQRDGILSE